MDLYLTGYSLADGGGAFRVKSGTFVGNGTALSITGVGFAPDMVIVDGVGGGNQAVAKTSSMPVADSKDMDGPSGFNSSQIVSLDPDGFSVGNASDSNTNGATYHWIAFKSAPGHMKIGTYAGAAGAQNIARRRLHAGLPDGALPGDGQAGPKDRPDADDAVDHLRRRGLHRRHPRHPGERLPGRHEPVGERRRHDLPLRGLEPHAGPDRGRELRGQQGGLSEHHGCRVPAGVRDREPVEPRRGKPDQRSGAQARVDRAFDRLHVAV